LNNIQPFKIKTNVLHSAKKSIQLSTNKAMLEGFDFDKNFNFANIFLALSFLLQRLALHLATTYKNK
jgi:hypothetical protein